MVNEKIIFLMVMISLITMSVSAASVITAPSGTFALGETRVLPVTVAGLNNASGVCFNLTYNQGLFTVDNVTISSSYPDATVTTHINNATGLLLVAVTDTEGITATGATPLVDIKFRSLGGSGTTSLTIPTAYWSDSAGASVLMSGDSLKSFDLYPFDIKTAGVIEAKLSMQSEIRIDTGVLSSGASVRIPVSVANVTSVNNITIGMGDMGGIMFNGTHIVIEDVMINESAPAGTVFVLEDTWIANEGWGQVSIHIKNPNITAVGLTPVVDLVIRPTDWSGAENLMVHPYHCSYSTPVSPDNHFSFVNSGQVVTNGGGAQPGDGAIRFGDVFIEGASTAKYPIEVKLPVGAMKVFTPFYYNSTFYNVTALAINATTNTTYGAYLCESELYSGEGRVTVANTQGLPTNEFTPLIDVNIKTFAQYGSTPFSLSKYYGPDYVVSSPISHIAVSYPFRTVTHGNVTVTPKRMPDLVGEIVDAPVVMMKDADNSLHFNTTFIVKNIGYADVTNSFDIQAKFGQFKSNMGFSDDIPVGKNLTLYVWMNVDPKATGTDV
ncbi:MAG: cohesin domain-containing protein, partial [Methanoregula sp.]|nr:cohesin domain-containing protein [Methanoregula sp.]